jgi:hypothetical protein
VGILIIQKDGVVVAINPIALNFVSTDLAEFSVVENPIKVAQISLAVITDDTNQVITDDTNQVITDDTNMAVTD